MERLLGISAAAVDYDGSGGPDGSRPGAPGAVTQALAPDRSGKATAWVYGLLR